MDTLPLQGGSSGTSNGGTSNGGSSNGGTANGGTANGGTANGGTSQGGSANPGVGGTGQGGAGGSGTGGTMAQGGSGGSGVGGMMAQGGTGGDGEPDAGGPDPNEDAVSFSDVFPILVDNCGGCHGNPNGLPGFAQANNEAASYAESQQVVGGQQIAARIIARAVTARTMPPQCQAGQLGQGACLSVAEAAELQAWVADGALP